MSPHWWSNSCASDSAHVAAFEVDYGELFGFLGPNQAGTTTAVRKISQCASRANCGRNCGTRSQLPQSSSVSDRSRRSLAIPVCRQGVRFCARCCRSMLMSAKTEFTNEGVEHRGFEPRTPLPARDVVHLAPGALEASCEMHSWVPVPYRHPRWASHRQN